VLTRRIYAWALYDWANSAFATTVIAGFFPLFFKQYWSVGVDATISSFRLGVANSVGSLLVLLLAPVLGAIADQGALKKMMLTAFGALGIGATGALSGVAQGDWPWAVILYVAAGLGFAGANVFYDALLLDVAERKDFDRVSALGFALGYLGGGLMFAGCIALTQWPHAFGLAGAEQAVRYSFLLVALWWAVFSIPLLRHVHEQGTPARRGVRAAISAGLSQLAATARHVRRLRVLVLFLAAYWLYIDGVDTIVRMAVDYGLALGFSGNDLILALLIVQFVGFPAALAFGWVGGRLGPKAGILIGIAVYMFITIWGYFMHATWEFYTIATLIGLVQGGVQSLSRSFYARLVPAGAGAEFFGFYNLLGKFAAVIGPVLMGWVALVTGDSRVSILSLLVLFTAGAGLLLMVPAPDDRAPASIR